MSSKRDYVAVARIIRDARDDWGSPTTRDDPVSTALGQVASGLCSVFASDNPRFDRERFLAACGLT